MGLTYRETKGSALTIAELDGNFQYFTGSHAITGSLTVSGSIELTGSISDTVGTYQPFYQSEVNLSTSDISTLNTIPFTLIEAPGAGKFIQVSSCIVEFTYGGGSISGDDNIEIYTCDASTYLAGNGYEVGSISGFLGIDSNLRAYLSLDNTGNIIENAPLIATNGPYDDDDPTMGGSTSTLKFYINYSITTI